MTSCGAPHPDNPSYRCSLDPEIDHENHIADVNADTRTVWGNPGYMSRYSSNNSSAMQMQLTKTIIKAEFLREDDIADIEVEAETGSVLMTIGNYGQVHLSPGDAAMLAALLASAALEAGKNG